MYAEWEAQGVQLWEGGPYWAKCNLGAITPQGTGYYFWWSDTVGYKRVGSSWNAVDGSTNGFSFVEANCPLPGLSQLQSAGYVDSEFRLVPARDAASKYLGLPWRMPTTAEIGALSRNTTSTCTTRDGVSGVLFTGIGAYSSKSIFIPFAGVGNGTALGAGWTRSAGGYLTLGWCSDIFQLIGSYSGPYYFYHRHTNNDGGQLDEDEWRLAYGTAYWRYGLQIRPVIGGD